MSGTGDRPNYAEDRAEIENLMARYLFAMDWNDYDAYAECFTEDGVLDYAMGIAEGRETIRAEAKRFKDNVGQIFVRPDGKPAKLRHVVAHKAITVDGDRAWNTGFHEMVVTILSSLGCQCAVQDRQQDAKHRRADKGHEHPIQNHDTRGDSVRGGFLQLKRLCVKRLVPAAQRV